MKISSRRFACVPALAACTLAFAAPASAAPVTADLHVEAGGRALVPDYSYRTDATAFKTDTRKPACGGSGQTKSLAGPTALGLLAESADTAAAVRPVGISDKFSFGLLVCGVGAFTASDSAFWLYKVNRVAPEVGADQFRLKRADQVLWYFQDTKRKINTGDELVVSAPARAQAGTPVTVTVLAYASNGVGRPAAGARLLTPGGTVITDRTGQARLRLDKPGYASLRAGRGSDIPSRVVRMCVATKIEDCPPVLGRRIFGTDGPDRLSGTNGPDVITGGAGGDTIDVRGGGIDKVRCGEGIDRVRLRRGDRASRDCELVNGRLRNR